MKGDTSMINSKEIRAGQRFKYDGEEWICTSNDGFIFSADNLNKTSVRTNIMFVGLSEDVELIV